MNLIEQAAKRLEELRQAGADLPVHGKERSSKIGAAKSASRPTPDFPVDDEATGFLQSQSSARAVDDERQSASPRVELDWARLTAAGFVTPEAPRSQIADEFRVIKRPLIANAFGKATTQLRNRNLIMITSALPGEGKSFSSVNLAISMAMELDRSVLLVDADVARPSLPKLLGLPAAQGLLDLLLDESIEFGQVLLRTNMDKLTVLPCGTQHPRATELLASDGMAKLLADMAQHYPDRLIIFDSPPLLVTTEARVLATHMGQVICVVGAETTLQSEVQQALATIEACPLKFTVLNQACTAARGAYGYGYGYGYAT